MAGVMIFVAVAMVLIGSVLSVTQSNALLSYRSRQMNAATYAAEALLERAYLAWQQTMAASSTGLATNSQIQTAIVLNDMIPQASENDKLAGFTYPASVNGVANLSITALASDGTTITDANGVPQKTVSTAEGVVYRYKIVAFATVNPLGRNPITVGIQRYFTRRDDSMSVGVFLQDSEGIHPGDKLIFDASCQVHSNGTLYAAAYATPTTSSVQFQGPVSYVKGYVEGFPPDAEVAAGTVAKAPIWKDGKTYSLSATRPGQLSPSPALEPNGIDQVAQTSSTNANTTDGYREIIEPPSDKTAADPYAAVRMYNLAGVVITFTQNYNAQGVAGAPSFTVTGPGGQALPGGDAVASALKTAFNTSTGSFDQSRIYDMREASNVQVTTLHIDTLGDVVASKLPDFNGVLYVTDQSTPPAGIKKAIRLINGARLPSSGAGGNKKGFTVASQNAVYVQGDYNTDARGSSQAYNPTSLPSNASLTGATEMTSNAHVPAAILADAVTVLSNSWSDTKATSSSDPSTKPASSTTVEASIVAGVSLAKSTSSTSADQYIQGGVQNIVRLAEDWTNQTLTLNGSLSELYSSAQFTGPWAVYPNYLPGNRRVVYDSNLKTSPPPGQPPISTYVRGEWNRL